MRNSAPPKARGRPLQFPKRIIFAMTDEMGEALDRWREHQPDHPSRLEAMRRILGERLQADGFQQER